jgi:hypothetical protein
MRTISRSVVAIVCMAIIAAGAASGDPSPWSSKKPPARQDGWAARGEERPLLVGRVDSDHRGARYLEVRGHSTTYVVDLARTKIEGARLGKIERGDRVVVWGRVIRHRTIEAARIRVLRDSDKLPCSQCGRTDCFHSDRHHYEPGVTPSRPHKEKFDERSRDTLDGRVVRASSRLTHRTITVASVGREWRVEVPTSAQIRRGSSRISVHEIREGEYVRVRGERLGGQRFRAERVDVDPRSASRPDKEESFTGSIRNVDPRRDRFGLQLSFFEVCSVRLTRGARLTRAGRTISLRDLRENDRVRVYGRLDPDSRVIEAHRVEVQ